MPLRELEPDPEHRYLQPARGNQQQHRLERTISAEPGSDGRAAQHDEVRTMGEWQQQRCEPGWQCRVHRREPSQSRVGDPARTS